MLANISMLVVVAASLFAAWRVIMLGVNKFLMFDDARRSADVSKNKDEQLALCRAFGRSLIYACLLLATVLSIRLFKGSMNAEESFSDFFGGLIDKVRYFPIPALLLSHRHWRIVRHNDWFDRERNVVPAVEYGKIFLPTLSGSIVIVALARALQIYIISRQNMPATEFFQGLAIKYGVSTIVITTFAMILIRLFDVIRYHPNRDPILFVRKSMIPLVGGMAIIAGLVYGTGEIEDRVTYVSTTGLLFAVFLSKVRLAKRPLRLSLEYLVSGILSYQSGARTRWRSRRTFSRSLCDGHHEDVRTGRTAFDARSETFDLKQ